VLPMACGKLPFVVVPVLIPSSSVTVHVRFLAGLVIWRAGEVRRACLAHHFPSTGRSVSDHTTFTTPPLPSATKHSSTNVCSHATSRRLKTNPT